MKSDFFLWSLFFLYSCLVALTIQFLILPCLLPQFHWRNGLLLSTDSISIHQIAQSQALLISREGWQKWLLSPLGQTSAGIVSVFYALFVPKPWIMIPIFAALHSGSAIILYKIISLFEKKANRWIKIAAVIPFLAFPSAAFFYAQLLKDSYFIFGNILFIYLWLLWLKRRKNEPPFSLRQYFFHIIVWAFAYVVVWVIRPYWGQVFFFESIVIVSLLTVNQVYFLFKDITYWQKRIIYWGLSLIIVLAFGGGILMKSLPSTMVSEAPANEEIKVQLHWTPFRWLPTYLDSALQSMAYRRKAFIIKYAGSGTNVDTDRIFQSAKEMASYLPRALYVGFFMPTTAITFQKGINPAGKLMRWITGFEMIFIYLCYPFLLLVVWSWRKKLELWILLLWALTGILLYALTSPNIGALYRFRYGFLMTLASLGILKAGILINKSRLRRKFGGLGC